MLRRLVENLRACSPPSLEIGSVLAARWEEWLPGRPLAYKPDGYTRTCAYRDPCFEVLLLNWAPGSASAIHDHGDQHCWMLVLDGNLEVDDYVRLDSGETPGYAHVERCGSRTARAGRDGSALGPLRPASRHSDRTILEPFPFMSTRDRCANFSSTTSSSADAKRTGAFYDRDPSARF